jgi:hypothetical protein
MYSRVRRRGTGPLGVTAFGLALLRRIESRGVRGGAFLWGSAPSMISPPSSYRLDCRHHVGSGKDSGEQEVALHQRKTGAETQQKWPAHVRVGIRAARSTGATLGAVRLSKLRQIHAI